MKSNQKLLVGIVLSALVLGIIALVATKADLPEQPADTAHETDVSNTTATENTGTSQPTAPTPVSARVSLTAPVGGEVLCLGDTFNIQWESRGVTSVAVSIYRDTGAAPRVDIIGAYPATYNDAQTAGVGIVPWEVGETFTYSYPLREASGYRIMVRATDGSSAVSRSGIFTIERCQG